MKKIVVIILFPILFIFADTYENYVYNVSGRIEPFLLVDKTRQKLFVVSGYNPGSIALIDTFRVTTGRVIGNKEREGDLKTPEGIYKIIRKLDGSRLPDKYGPLAYVLDYPNYIDRLENKNGSNIWIHGRNEEIKDYQTEGCVSLENGHILDLAKYIKINTTNIVIVDSLEIRDLDWQSLHSELATFVSNWRKNWSSGKLEDYFQAYSDDFRENGNSFQKFKARKQSLEKIYAWKKIEVDSLWFLLSKREILATFNQTYVSPNFSSYGTKKLLILRENAGLKIIREEFSRIGGRISVDEEIQKFLKAWEISWESLEIDRYRSFYSEDFMVDGKDLDWYMDDKEAKFSKIKKINVQISELKTFSSKVDHWVVTFKQHYWADNYSDVGIKTMIVEKQKNGEFKILNEVWRRSR